MGTVGWWPGRQFNGTIGYTSKASTHRLETIQISPFAEMMSKFSLNKISTFFFLRSPHDETKSVKAHQIKTSTEASEREGTAGERSVNLRLFSVRKVLKMFADISEPSVAGSLPSAGEPFGRLRRTEQKCQQHLAIIVVILRTLSVSDAEFPRLKWRWLWEQESKTHLRSWNKKTLHVAD